MERGHRPGISSQLLDDLMLIRVAAKLRISVLDVRQTPLHLVSSALTLLEAENISQERRSKSSAKRANAKQKKSATRS